MEKIDSKSLNITENNICKLKELFPDAVTEGKIDYDVLRTLLGDEIEERKERYQFTWPGKSESIKIAQAPSSATLRPSKEKSKNWGTTENIYIEGDNLEVLKQLQKTYHGKIKLIYIDPPYNTGGDFVYKDDYVDSISNYIRQTNQNASTNPDTSGRYHTDWLSMMYPRLILARNLLSENGVIFISIDDHELYNLKKICDEIYGESNYLASFIVKNNSAKNQSAFVSVTTEYCLSYTKNYEHLRKTEQNWRVKKKGAADINRYFQKRKNEGVSLELIREEIQELYSRPKYSHLSRWNKVDEYGVFADDNLSRANGPKDYTIINPSTGKECPIPSRGWGKSKEELLRLQKENLIWFGDGSNPPRLKTYLKEDSISVPDNYIFVDTSSDKKYLDEILGPNVFDYPKSVDFIQSFIEMAAKGDNEIVLDFFSGSGTTAHAVLKNNYDNRANTKFIMVQLPEKCDTGGAAYHRGYNTICDIGEERIRRAGEKIKKEWEEKNQFEGLFAEEKEFPVDIGFKVFKLDSTNIIPWDNEKEIDEHTLFTLDSVFKEDRSKEDVLYEIMLKYGIFDQSVAEIEINGKPMYRIGKRHMIVCLEDGISSADVTAIGNLSPRVVVFKEAGFNDDNDKINAEYNLKKYGVEDVKCV